MAVHTGNFTSPVVVYKSPDEGSLFLMQGFSHFPTCVWTRNFIVVLSRCLRTRMSQQTRLCVQCLRGKKKFFGDQALKIGISPKKSEKNIFRRDRSGEKNSSSSPRHAPSSHETWDKNWQDFSPKKFFEVDGKTSKGSQKQRKKYIFFSAPHWKSGNTFFFSTDHIYIYLW